MKYDVVVIGAGPAGMSAAIRLRKTGSSVAVIDEQPAPGGQIWRGVERNAGPVAEALGTDYRKGAALVQAFRGCGADYMPETQVWQIEEGWNLFLTSGGEARRIGARVVLLANGAQERPVPFPGWTLPGVMTVGAAQILLKSGGMLPQGDVWIAGAGPLPLLYATQLLGLEGRIAGFLDTSRRPGLAALTKLPGAWRDIPGLLKGARWLRDLRKSGKMVRDFHNLRAGGEGRLQYLEWQSASEQRKVKADVLLVHEGVVPRIHETMALGCDHEWNDAQNYFTPRLDKWGQTSKPGLFVAGDAGGIGGWLTATLSGEIAALGISKHLDVSFDAEGERHRVGLDKRIASARALRPFLDALYPPPTASIADEVIVCRCEEVTAAEIRSVAKVSAPDPNAVKAATRCGMGPCQGRQCGYTVQALVAEVHGIPPRDVSFFNIRPPLKPVTLGEIAALGDLEEAS